MSASELVNWVWETTIIVSLLLLVVLALRLPLARLLGARWAYLLWTLPVARLVFSLMPEPLQAGVMSVIPSGALGAVSAAAVLEHGLHIPPWAAVTLITVWLSGAVLVAVRLVVQQIRCRRKLLHDAVALGGADAKQVERVCQRMQVFPAVKCLESAQVGSPLLIGLIDPVLLLPERFLKESPEPELVVRHELVHLKRRDLWQLAGANLLRCIFWFNPLIYLAIRYFKADQEVACDQAVVATEPRSRRYNYGLAMVDVAQARVPAGVAFVSNEPALKRRARMLARHRNGVLQNATGLSVVLALVLIGATFGADATQIVQWDTPLTFPGPVPGPCG